MFEKVIKYVKTLIKWTVIAFVTGITGGTLGSVFGKCITYVTHLREVKPYVLFFLPLGGLVIAFMYKLYSKKGKIDTNRVIRSADGDENIPLVMIPLIFVSTVITHFLGGSAGREGAALQLGGCMGYNIGRIIKLKSENMHTIVMAGMSAVFSALFGTPVAAAVFSVEVVSVGVMHYMSLVPCLISSITAYLVSTKLGIVPEIFKFIEFGNINYVIYIKAMVIAVLCAVISITFCSSIKYSEKYMKKLFPNRYVRAVAGGVIIIILTLLIGSYDYNGAGMFVVERAMHGKARPEAFLLKILFTAITIGAGFKGGEIVPSFFIGSTFGCVVAKLIGLDPAFGAALGFIALFCGVVNCPIASLILSVEVFGADAFPVFAIVCAVSYMMSGRYGLYNSQKIVFSKTSDRLINKYTN